MAGRRNTSIYGYLKSETIKGMQVINDEYSDLLQHLNHQRGKNYTVG